MSQRLVDISFDDFNGHLIGISGVQYAFQRRINAYMPSKQFTISEEGQELLRSLLVNHLEQLENKGESSDQFETELTEDLIDLFENNTE